MNLFKNIFKYGFTFITAVSLFSFGSLTRPCDDIPETNKAIVAFVNSRMHKKVGTGECWDLAAAALNIVNAKWDGKQKFGKEVNYLKVCVYPGDIVQFEGVTLKYEQEKKIYTEKLLHHTAIIYEVKENGNFVIADQNTQGEKTVGIHPFGASTISKGTFKIYRPLIN